jgi:hypothetical protein
VTQCNGQLVDLDTNPEHCGDCAIDCTSNSGPNPNLTGQCLAGKCECQMGWADCTPNNANNACDVPLGTDQNCGGCGDKCNGNGRKCIDGVCKKP